MAVRRTADVDVFVDLAADREVEDDEDREEAREDVSVVLHVNFESDQA